MKRPALQNKRMAIGLVKFSGLLRKARQAFFPPYFAGNFGFTTNLFGTTLIQTPNFSCADSNEWIISNNGWPGKRAEVFLRKIQARSRNG